MEKKCKQYHFIVLFLIQFTMGVLLIQEPESQNIGYLTEEEVSNLREYDKFAPIALDLLYATIAFMVISNENLELDRPFVMEDFSFINTTRFPEYYSVIVRVEELDFEVIVFVDNKNLCVYGIGEEVKLYFRSEKKEYPVLTYEDFANMHTEGYEFSNEMASYDYSDIVGGELWVCSITGSENYLMR